SFKLTVSLNSFAIAASQGAGPCRAATGRKDAGPGTTHKLNRPSSLLKARSECHSEEMQTTKNLLGHLGNQKQILRSAQNDRLGTFFNKLLILQCLVQIRDDVINVLNANRDAHQAVGNSN